MEYITKLSDGTKLPPKFYLERRNNQTYRFVHIEGAQVDEILDYLPQNYDPAAVLGAIMLYEHVLSPDEPSPEEKDIIDGIQEEWDRRYPKKDPPDEE